VIRALAPCVYYKNERYINTLTFTFFNAKKLDAFHRLWGLLYCTELHMIKSLGVYCMINTLPAEHCRSKSALKYWCSDEYHDTQNHTLKIHFLTVQLPDSSN